MGPKKRQFRAISITLSFLTTPVSRAFSQLDIVKSEPTLMLWVLSAPIPFRCSIHGFPNSIPPRLAVASPRDKPWLNVNKPWYCIVVHQVPRCLGGPFRRSLFVRTMVSP
ncbi:hypothetical protein ARMGADRAFT_1014956 [Armillaria gallica]|uniref:Secreted protein n=1 Tax=Armillaria gallica TaxID=47427 RepID=A0A2H3DQS5_ARMGA|nr:hypothetical protein ARMGADRAFT_1014956 [Armillaria gallica]